MKAIILAAGYGTRLQSVTGPNVPKVLTMLNHKTLLDRTIDWLDQYVESITITACYAKDAIYAHLDKKQFYVDVKVSEEYYKPLGTSGGVRHALQQGGFDSTFLVVYGDVLTNISLLKMLRFHRENKALATLALCRMEGREDAGRVAIDIEGRITEFSEKGNGILTKIGNGGVYILEPEIQKWIPPGISDFGADIFPTLIDAKQRVFGYMLRDEEYLLDIGTPGRYHQAISDLKAGRVKRL